MKVKITVPSVGLLDNKPYPAVGDVVDIHPALAVSLINDKRAEPVAESAEHRETAAVKVAEKRSPGRPRKAVEG